MGNQVRSVFLLGILSVLLVYLGSLFGEGWMLVALIFALGMNAISYFLGDKLILALYRAREISPGEMPELYRIVQNLTQSAGLPMPRLYLIPSASPNAFATGRDPAHASVAVTSGILNILSAEELEGVLAHELSHVKNRDILIATIAATIAGAITFLARMMQWAAYFGGGNDDRRGGNALSLVGLLVFAVLAPIAAMIVQLAISRSREYLADESGAKISGHPEYLASALRRLAAGVSSQPMSRANPSTAHLFIVNPFSARSLLAIFSTHPPIEERIARLERMAGKL
ncbi:MAG: zinc metalloprotease HtpX [Candidatus Omnitrophica bacterium]|nr:zinc metalloprotease HtpX [Candidatus Omnitrophota bacterium]